MKKYKLFLLLSMPALLTWLVLLFLQLIHSSLDVEAIAQIIEMLIDISNIALIAYIYQQSNGKIVSIFLLFSILLLFVVDVLYFLVYSLPHEQKYIFVFDAAHFAYYITIILFIIFALLKYVLKLYKFILMLLLAIIIDLGMFAVFSIDPNYLSIHISLRNNIQIVQSSVDLILFSLAFLWLIYSRVVGSTLMAAGYIICTSSEFMMTSCYMTNMTFLLVYAELAWMLGLIFIMTGMIFVIVNKQYKIEEWMVTNTTIKTSLTFNTFSVVVTSLVLFFMVLKEFSIINDNFYIFFPSIVMDCAVIISLFSIISSRVIEQPLLQIQRDIEKTMKGGRKEIAQQAFCLVNPQRYSEIKNIETHIKTLISYVEKQSRDAAIGILAKQVAHDIRSPLAALNTCLKHLPQIPEHQRILMRNVVNRINDIANNLLQQYNLESEQVTSGLRVWLLVPLLENMVSEKRMQFEGKPIVLQEDISNQGFLAFSWFDHNEMKRVLSNLLNNASEALSKSGGKVTVMLNADDEFISLQIKDNGKGIAANKLDEVFKPGISLKKGGLGLGLSRAKEMIEAWHGKLSLYSTEGEGTVVDIQLPRAGAPSWFVSEIAVSDTIPIAILDDDQSVHDAWDQRLLAVSSHLKIVHHKTAESFREWYKIQAEPVQIFSDYELLNGSETGLDVLESLKLQNATLVTSHYENPELIKRCELAEISLLPKNLLAHIPVRLTQDVQKKREEEKILDLILIDDNSSLCQSWKITAELAGKYILTYSGLAEFEKDKSNINRKTPIYIDSDLAQDMRGEEYAKGLFDEGFKEIYLVTGYQPQDFGLMPWIREVKGKTPPF